MILKGFAGLRRMQPCLDVADASYEVGVGIGHDRLRDSAAAVRGILPVTYRRRSGTVGHALDVDGQTRGRRLRAKSTDVLMESGSVYAGRVRFLRETVALNYDAGPT